MKKNIFKSVLNTVGCMAVAGVALTSCTMDPDESNIYTFEGFTIEDYLSSHEELSNFDYIVKRARYDRILESYGGYTCFAPDNEAVIDYLDSLYTDPEAAANGNPHNGMADHGTLGAGQHVELEWLSDSLCQDITLYHLAGSSLTGASPITLMDMTSETSMNINTLLGRSIMVTVDPSTGLWLNESVQITNQDEKDDDKLGINGIVHQINKVLPRSNRLVANEMKMMDDKYGWFYEALEMTHLLDSLTKTKKDSVYQKADYDGGHLMIQEDYESLIKYTVFAETNDVLRAKGIEGIEGLISYANSVYSGAEAWYDYLRTHGLWNVRSKSYEKTVSTSDDYESRNNALNMYVAYHLLGFGLRNDVVTTYFNVVPSGVHGWTGDSYDYYQTMLPYTLVKAWNVRKEDRTFLNRWIDNNTLTDGKETVGSAAMHTVRKPGVELFLDQMQSPLNGYIYPLGDVLVYDKDVPNGVLRERMRIDWLSTLPEIMNNGWRYMYTNDVGKARIRFANDFFDNIRVYNGNNTHLGMNVRASLNSSTDKSYSLYQGDSFRGTGVADFAIKLPPVPEGDYELRIDFTMASHFGIVQYYIGESPDPSEMEALDIPMDCRMSYSDPRVGWSNALEESDYATDFGFTSDKDLRNRGWMRGLLSLVRENAKTQEEWIVRFRTDELRRILTRRHFKQGDYWLRVKSVLTDNPNAVFQLDFVEFMPTDLLQSPKYFEDMY